MIQEELENLGDFFPEDVRSQVLQLFHERWKMLHSPMHAAGYALDPEFINDMAVTSNEEVRCHCACRTVGCACCADCWLC